MEHEGIKKFKTVIDKVLEELDPSHFASLIGTQGEPESVKAHGEAAITQLKLELTAKELAERLWRIAVAELRHEGGEIKIPASLVQWGPVKDDKRIPITLDVAPTPKMAELLIAIDRDSGVTILAHAEGHEEQLTFDDGKAEQTPANTEPEPEAKEEAAQTERPEGHLDWRWWIDPTYPKDEGDLDLAAGYRMGFMSGTKELPATACPAFGESNADEEASALADEWYNGRIAYVESFEDGSWCVSPDCPLEPGVMGYNALLMGHPEADNPFTGAGTESEATDRGGWSDGWNRATFESAHKDHFWVGSAYALGGADEAEAHERALASGFYTAVYVSVSGGETTAEDGCAHNAMDAPEFRGSHACLYDAWRLGWDLFNDINLPEQPWFLNPAAPLPREAGRHAATNDRALTENPYNAEPDKNADPDLWEAARGEWDAGFQMTAVDASQGAASPVRTQEEQDASLQEELDKNAVDAETAPPPPEDPPEAPPVDEGESQYNDEPESKKKPKAKAKAKAKPKDSPPPPKAEGEKPLF